MVCSSSMKTMVWPSSLAELLEHGLQALLELAAVLGAGQQRGHVQRQHALALERLGHLAGHDALRQAFDDGGLAHAGLADQHRVVLGAALQHLDGAADLVVAADHRVELALRARSVRSMRVFLQRLALAFGLGAVHLLAAAHGLDGGFQACLRVRPMVPRDSFSVAMPPASPLRRPAPAGTSRWR
jgi:hypothetical protein